MEYEKIKRVIAEVLGIDEGEITSETKFIDDLGADSLDIYQIIMGLEEEFDIEIQADEVGQIVTVADVTERIRNVGKEL